MKIAALLLLGVFASIDCSWMPPGQYYGVSRVATRFERYFLSQGSKHYGKIPPKVDIVFVVDGSDSVRNTSFQRSVKFVKDSLDYFSISHGTTRVALVTFSSKVRKVFGLKAYGNRKCVLKAISRARYDCEGSALGNALQTVDKIFRSSPRPGAKRIVVVISDGYWNHGVNPSPVAAIIKNQLKAKIFVIGIGSEKNTLELRRIASFPRYQHLYLLRKARSLEEIIRQCTHLDKYTQCRGSGVKYDACGRRCKCVYGKLTQCCRVRKEFSSMSYVERARYLSAYKKLTTQEPYKARYEAFINIHEAIFDSGIHGQTQFLPWHRWFILILENMLREIDCRVTVPYWAWSLWSHDPWSTSHIWGSFPNGLGGNGVFNPTTFTSCVATGQFSQSQGNWSITDGTCLQRSFNDFPPDHVEVTAPLGWDFTDFEIYLRGYLHDMVHCLIGGTMCTVKSATAPEFFLHHGFVDKIWNDWQKTHVDNYFIQFPGNMTATSYKRADFVDLKKQPGCVSVCYDEPNINNASAVIATLKAIPPATLYGIPRLQTASMPAKARELFKISNEEKARCEELERMVRGNIQTSAASLNLRGYERIIGFRLPTVPDHLLSRHSSLSAEANVPPPLPISHEENNSVSNSMDDSENSAEVEENENEFEEDMDDGIGHFEH